MQPRSKVVTAIAAIHCLTGAYFAVSAWVLAPVIKSLPSRETFHAENFALLIAVLLTIIGICYVWIGYAIWRRRLWARVVGLILAFLWTTLMLVRLIEASASSKPSKYADLCISLVMLSLGIIVFTVLLMPKYGAEFVSRGAGLSVDSSEE